MKKYGFIIVILFIISINILLSDNWEPYPYNKTLTYTHSPYTREFENGGAFTFEEGQYFSVRYDSMVVDSNSKTYYSDRYRRHRAFKCVNDSEDFTLYIQNWRSETYRFQEDFYTLKNDTAIFYSYMFFFNGLAASLDTMFWQEIKFPLNLQPGEVYLQNFSKPFIIKCISCDKVLTFGKEDSISQFEVVFYPDTVNLTLSKTFGFIDFIPISQIYTPYFEKDVQIKLAGIKDSAEVLGMQLPGKQSEDKILPFKKGDVIKWRNTHCSQTYHRLDSVINVVRTQDSIDVLCRTMEVNTLVPFRNNPWEAPYWAKVYYNKLTFPMNVYRTIFNSPTNDVIITPFINDTYGIDIRHKLFEELEIYGKDTSINVVVHEFGGVIDTITCSSTIGTDIDGLTIYNSRFGISRLAQWMPCGFEANGYTYIQYIPDAICIVGFKMGDDVWGDISMPDTTKLAVIENTEKTEPHIYPNPAQDYIYINSPLVEGAGGVWQYQIYDLLGNCVQSGMLESNKININRLSSGFYTVRFFNGGKQVVEKLMKE